jgi:hypothetical protein
MIELPKRDGSAYVIDAIVLAKLQQDYPKIDVAMELRKMRNWLEANPANRKRDVHRFVINWLNRARPQAAGSVTRETSRHYAVVAERIREPAEPVRHAEPEMVQAHLDQVKRMLGMRRAHG